MLYFTSASAQIPALTDYARILNAVTFSALDFMRRYISSSPAGQ
jgi:hypothetical protein